MRSSTISFLLARVLARCGGRDGEDEAGQKQADAEA